MANMLETAQHTINQLNKSITETTEYLTRLKDDVQLETEKLQQLKNELKEWQEVRTIFQAKKAQEEA